MEFSTTIRVYIEDTDAGGIVYYVNYLKFMERARTELMRTLGFNKAGANREGYQFVVRKAEVDYKKPARLDDQLTVTAAMVSMRGASIEFDQQVMREGVVLCSGRIKIACVDGQTLHPQPLPTEIVEQLSA